MKTSLLSLAAAVALLASTASFAATPDHDRDNDRRTSRGQDDRKDHDKDNNYGYDKNHKVTAQERARWEAQHKNDRR